MAKKVKTVLKLQIEAGKANPAPPLGPTLAQHGINISEFCQKFNDATKDKMGYKIPVIVTIYEDRSYDFELKQPLTSDLIKKAAGIKKGTDNPLRNKVAKLTKDQLMEIVDIERVSNKNKFNKWFDYKYKLSENENNFLENLIEENELFLTFYNEQNLTTKFIAPILNKIKFQNKYIKDWYGYKIKCKLNGYFLSGEPDFSIATGISVPKTPYFFLQEYKRSINPKGNPEFQVLAAMLAAMTISKVNVMRGAYVIGETWKFIILEKSEKDNYEYFVSKGHDCLDLGDLTKIYTYLQAVKHLYCK